MDKIKMIGIEGEQIARHVFKEIFKVDNIFQADWVIEKNDKYYLIEVKHQERFKKFKNDDIEGHGLPISQVKARIKFQEKTGIRAMLFVIEIPTKKIFYQWIDELEKTKYQDTHIKKRRIYNIDKFISLKHKIQNN